MMMTPVSDCEGWRNGNSEEVVLQALDLVINSANSPLMIMCNLGRHRTGTVVGE